VITFSKFSASLTRVFQPGAKAHPAVPGSEVQSGVAQVQRRVKLSYSWEGLFSWYEMVRFGMKIKNLRLFHSRFLPRSKSARGAPSKQGGKAMDGPAKGSNFAHGRLRLESRCHFSFPRSAWECAPRRSASSLQDLALTPEQKRRLGNSQPRGTFRPARAPTAHVRLQ
jgi:hypothetical protein